MLCYLTDFRSLPLAAALAGGIFLVDTRSSLQFAVASLYVIVVLVAAHDLRRRGVVIMGVTCALLTVLSHVLVHGFALAGTAPLRSAVSLISILIATILVLRQINASRRSSGSAQTSLASSRQKLSTSLSAFILPFPSHAANPPLFCLPT